MILTKTSELSIQCLVYIAVQPDGHLVTPSEIAEKLDESPSYMSKVLGAMARAGLLKSHRGMAGGFELAANPDKLSLLDVVELCQGTIVGNYCHEAKRADLRNTCGYHQAMDELQRGMCRILSKWTLSKVVAARPPSKSVAPLCKLRPLLEK